MKGFRFSVAALLCVALTGVALASDPLPRKGYLGIRVYPLERENAFRLGLVDTTGVWLQLLSGDSPAMAAGLKADDVIHAVDDVPVPDIFAFSEVMTPKVAGERVRFTITRGGNEKQIDVTLAPRPMETMKGLDVAYTSFVTPDSVRLRAIIARPRDPAEEELVGLLLIQPHAAESVESGGYNMYRELALNLAERGFAVMRFDRRGMGDSEGSPYLDMDLEAEIADTEAALGFFRKQPGVRSDRFFLFGTGLGGVIAAVLAERHPDVRGVILYAVPGRNWPEYALASLRHQAGLSGEDPARIDELSGSLGLFFEEFAAGEEIGAILERHPEMREFGLDEHGRVFGRSESFFRQVVALDIPDAYARVSCSVLVPSGASDFATPPGEAEAILSILDAAGNPDHIPMRLAETDGLLSRADSPSSSMEATLKGDLFFNYDVLDLFESWLHKRSSAH